MKKKFKTLYLCIFGFMIMPMITYGQLPKNDPTWQLVFTDEFDSVGVNPHHWNQVDWRSELYAYIYNGSCDTVKTHRPTGNCSNLLFDTIGTGKITIRSKRENPPVSVWSKNDCVSPATYGYHDFDYTTAAWLKSNDHFKYGYFEIRCKLPYMPDDSTSWGLGADFWLYENPAGAGGICYSEIDIFEFITQHDSTYHNHVHTCNSWFNQCSSSVYHSSQHFFGSMQFSGFHTFALKWTPTTMEYYQDDTLIYTSTNHPDSMIPMSIILDFGLPTTETYPISNTLLPYNYEIDYIKVWQPSERCDSNITCNFNAATYNNTKVNNISIGGSGCTATVGQNDNVTLKAADYIEFKEGFSVQLGGTMSAETENCFHPVHTWIAPPQQRPATNEIPKLLIDKFFHIR